MMLEKERDLQVVGEAAHGHQAVREAKRLRPDVVVLDIAMPQLNGLEATRQILREVPLTGVLILSAYSDDPYIEQAMEAGASGYLIKQAMGSDLFRAIREIAKGNAYFSPPIARRMLKQWREKFRDGSPDRTRVRPLTERQSEILQLVAEGHQNKQIAGLLSISVKTVEKHRQDLMDTLDIHNIANLTRYAVASGVVESNRVPDWSRIAPPAPAIDPATISIKSAGS